MNGSYFVVFPKFTLIYSYLFNVTINNNLCHIHVLNKIFKVWIKWNKSVPILLKWKNIFRLVGPLYNLLCSEFLFESVGLLLVFIKNDAVIRADVSYLTTNDLTIPCIVTVKVQFFISWLVTNVPNHTMFKEWKEYRA